MSTILIIDDDERSRAQVRAVLESDGFVVVGEAGDGVSGVTAALNLIPDVVLVDISLPDIEGFEVAATLRRDRPDAMVVLTSTREAAAYGPRLAKGPWLGFIPKDELSGNAIRVLAPRR